VDSSAIRWRALNAKVFLKFDPKAMAVLFAGEGHGFKKAESTERALDAELYFYSVHVFRTRLVF
jgi:hypothetical protein